MASVGIVRRLAFAKYIYAVGVDQARLPEPMNAAALLNFHDAAELFLQIASEHLDAGPPGKQRLTFMEYWEILSSKLPEPLSHKEAMRRLNNARISLKHHGILPSPLEIASFREVILSFFEENISRVFDLQFQALSLIDFVATPKAKQSLEEAVAAQRSGKLEDALGHIALAFRQLLDSYEDSKAGRTTSPFFFGRDFTFMSSSMLKIDTIKEPKFARFIDSVRDSIMALQDVTKMLSLGVDYRRYSRFQLHTPTVLRMMDHSYRVVFRLPRMYELTSDDVTFCVNFVIETALALQGFDYNTPEFTPEAKGEKEWWPSGA